MVATESSDSNNRVVDNIRCICINCYSTIDAERKLAGTRQKCPQCGNTLIIPKPSLKTGEVIAGYKIDKLIGIGGMGEVYHAQSIEDQRDYAIKIIRPSVINDVEIESFKNEIRMNLRVSHNNFIKAYEAGTDEKGRLFLVMEFAKGRTLEDHIVKKGRLDEDHALSIILTVAKALKNAWDNWQIIHRDLKPSNILITQSNVIKIMDLGVSVNIRENATEKQIIGTPYYISPEQINTPHDIDQRSDIYSLGATMYELITGMEPYKGKNSDEIFENVLKDEPTSPSEARPDISKETCALIQNFMMKDRNKRPNDWDAAIVQIENTLNRYKSGGVSKNSPYNKPGMAYVMKDDLNSYTPYILLGIGTLVGFLAFAFWVVKTYIP